MVSQHEQYTRNTTSCMCKITIDISQTCTGLQAAGKSQQETNDMLATYVRQQVEEKGAQETHMCVYLFLNCQQSPTLSSLHMHSAESASLV